MIAQKAVFIPEEGYHIFTKINEGEDESFMHITEGFEVELKTELFGIAKYIEFFIANDYEYENATEKYTINIYYVNMELFDFF